jgi:hypothetical protein
MEASGKEVFAELVFSVILSVCQDRIVARGGPDGLMLVPIILGSDKTTVSVATGNNEYYPLYLSIGNIHNNVRRAHRNGVVLLAFLAIPKSAPFSISVFISMTLRHS